jgi:hypothetical protein
VLTRSSPEVRRATTQLVRLRSKATKSETLRAAG